MGNRDENGKQRRGKESSRKRQQIKRQLKRLNKRLVTLRRAVKDLEEEQAKREKFSNYDKMSSSDEEI